MLEPGEKDVWLDVESFGAALDSIDGRINGRLTFDDGNASDVAHALPELRRRGMSATFFVVAGRVGQRGFLDAPDLRELVASGMRIGCHGMRHRAWRGLAERDLHEELVEARQVLETIIERPVAEAACPFGSYDRRVLRALDRAGYRRVYTSDGGVARADAWLQARTTIDRRHVTELGGSVGTADPHRVSGVLRRAKRVAKRWR